MRMKYIVVLNWIRREIFRNLGGIQVGIQDYKEVALKVKQQTR